MAKGLKEISDEKLRRLYLKQLTISLNKTQAYQKLANLFGVCRNTIMYHLNDSFKSYVTNAKKQYRREHRDAVRKESHRYRKKHSKEIKQYNREYRRMTRHLDYYLPSAFRGEKRLPLQELVLRLKVKTGLHLMPDTLEIIVDGYKDRHGLSPVIERRGSYSLNDDYYSKVKVGKVRKYVWRK